jgi:DNA-directed RNA polymerase subunit RPC12/RpoP
MTVSSLVACAYCDGTLYLDDEDDEVRCIHCGREPRPETKREETR